LENHRSFEVRTGLAENRVKKGLKFREDKDTQPTVIEGFPELSEDCTANVSGRISGKKSRCQSVKDMGGGTKQEDPPPGKEEILNIPNAAKQRV